MRRRPLRIQPLTIALSLAFSSAYAAPPGADEDARHAAHAKELEALTVTATPLRGGAEELAAPIEVLAGPALEAARAATLGEMVSDLPGVQSSNFGAGVGRPIIRGLDGARVSVLSGGLATQDASTVSQDHAPTIEPFLADQIEVLKGPATLLYGSGAIGGIVNVVDGRIPEFAPEAVFAGRAESRFEAVNDGFTHLLRVDGGDERIGLHADAVYRDQNDYATPDGEQANSFNTARSAALGGSLLGDWGFLGLSAAHLDNQYGNPGEPGDALAAGVRLDLEQRRYELRGARHAPLPGFDSLRLNFAHTDYAHAELEGDEVGTRFIKQANEGRVELAHSPWAQWNGALGLQASSGRFEALGEEAFVPATRQNARGVFWLEQREWQALKLQFGARFDRVEIDPDTATTARRFTPHSYSASALWRINAHWRVNLNLDQAERAPAEEELYANGPHVATDAFEIGDSALRRERARQAELGLHYHSNRLDFELSAYRNHFSDFIYLQDTGRFEDELPVREWSQRGARFRGLDAKAELLLNDGDRGRWELHLLADRVSAEFAAGGHVPRIPPARLGATLRWEFDRWQAALGALRHARQDEVALNESTTSGYTLSEAHLSYHVDGENSAWEWFVDAHNLGNETARVHTSYLKDRVVLPGRNFAIGVRVYF